MKNIFNGNIFQSDSLDAVNKSWSWQPDLHFLDASVFYCSFAEMTQVYFMIVMNIKNDIFLFLFIFYCREQTHTEQQYNTLYQP